MPIFLISLKAGGVGLNLTAADTVIHYDPWWNPAVEAQATDRAHRIGQTKSVFVHRLIAIGTIEEKMEVLKARKQALVAGILDAEAGATLNLTEEDVAALFEPAATLAATRPLQQQTGNEPCWLLSVVVKTRLFGPTDGIR